MEAPLVDISETPQCAYIPVPDCAIRDPKLIAPRVVDVAGQEMPAYTSHSTVEIQNRTESAEAGTDVTDTESTDENKYARCLPNQIPQL